MVATQTLQPISLSSSNSTPKNEWSDRQFSDVICLFDVDGTLSASRKVKPLFSKEENVEVIIIINFHFV